MGDREGATRRGGWASTFTPSSSPRLLSHPAAVLETDILQGSEWTELGVTSAYKLHRIEMQMGCGSLGEQVSAGKACSDSPFVCLSLFGGEHTQVAAAFLPVQRFGTIERALKRHRFVTIFVWNLPSS